MRRKSFKRRSFKRKASFKRKGSLRKKIARVAKRCAPVYKVVDDTSNDITYNAITGAINVGNYPLYKYFGIPFGSGGSQPNAFFQAGSFPQNTQSWNPRFISCSIRGEVGLPNTFTNLLATVRMIWFWDTDAATVDSGGTIVNNFPANNSHVLAVASSSAVTTPLAGGVFTGYNPTMVGPGKRYRILKDRTIQLSSVGKTVQKFVYKIRLNKVCGLRTVAVNTCCGCNLGLCIVSDTAPGNVPYVTFSARMCYTG